MAALEGIAPNLRTVLTQFMDRRGLCHYQAQNEITTMIATTNRVPRVTSTIIHMARLANMATDQLADEGLPTDALGAVQFSVGSLLDILLTFEVKHVGALVGR